MVFKKLSILEVWMKVASASEGLEGECFSYSFSDVHLDVFFCPYVTYGNDTVSKSRS